MTPEGDPERAARAAQALGRGEFIVVAEREGSRFHGNLGLAAQFVTPSALNAMTQRAGGMIVLCLTDSRCEQLGLRAMGDETDGWRPTVTIDHVGVEVGASVEGRARTIAAVVDPHSDPRSFRRPGHVMPTRGRPGGVLERPGRTEAVTDLARVAGCDPAVVLSLVMNDDGTLAGEEQLEAFGARHDLPLVTPADVAALRCREEPIVERVAETRLPTTYGEFDAVAYRDLIDGEHHIALLRGRADGAERVTTRVQRRCFVGDVTRATACGCGGELESAMRRLASESPAVLVYLMAGAGIDAGIVHGDDPADGAGVPLSAVAAQILGDLGVRSIVELEGGETSVDGLDRQGIAIAGRQSLQAAPGRDR